VTKHPQIGVIIWSRDTFLNFRPISVFRTDDAMHLKLLCRLVVARTIAYKRVPKKGAFWVT